MILRKLSHVYNSFCRIPLQNLQKLLPTFVKNLYKIPLQKLLNKVHWFFFFNFHYSGSWVKKRSCCDLCKSVLPMFSSKSFIMSGLILFRSLVHFEYDGRECSNFLHRCVKRMFILLHRAVQFPQHYILKSGTFFHCIFLPLLS